MHEYDNDIIAAIATGLTPSAIGIIRVSGNGCFALLEKIFTKKPPYKHKYIHYGYILDRDNNIVDEVLVSIFKSPNSYTGEDAFEINCHGGLIVLNKILKILFKAGARMAQPGEFTKRAFLNGKLDLSQAEAVEKIISAKSERALKIAERQLKGNFSTKIDKIREKILFLMAENEVIIDHPEDDISSVSKQEKLKTIKDIEKQLKEILKSAKYGNTIFEGILLALAGKPNVGKSSLLNIITGMDRSIVTDIPGTTRDIVSENFTINGIPFTILDTAGIRKTNDIVENLGVEKSKNAIKKADIVLVILDASEMLTKEDIDIIEQVKSLNKNTVYVLNKVDKRNIINLSSANINTNSNTVVELSCKTKDGIEELENKIAEIAMGNVDDADIVSLNAQQVENLNLSIDMCQQLKTDITNDIDPPLISVDLISLSDYLSETIGIITNEDMLDTMFKNFCIGK